MFILKDAGTTYKVKFRYGKRKRKRVPSTTAVITVIKENGEEYAMEARVSFFYKDKFDKNAGRKYAFTKLMKEMFPGEENKPLRTSLWSEYHAKRGDKPL